MKKQLILLVLSLFFSVQYLTAQEAITPPSEGKAVIYFVRTSHVGAIINFKYYDGSKYLGKFSGRNYIRYECEPGKHTFWASSENLDFIEADVKAGSIYFIEAKARMGMIKASVKLFPVDRNSEKQLKKINKVIKRTGLLILDADEIAKQAPKLEKKIKRSLEKIEKKKKRGKIKRITPDMEYIKE